MNDDDRMCRMLKVNLMLHRISGAANCRSGTNAGRALTRLCEFVPGLKIMSDVIR